MNKKSETKVVEKEVEATPKVDLEVVLSTISEALTGINKKLDDFITKPVPDAPKQQPVSTRSLPNEPQQAKFPIPVEYREIVDTVLNKEFEIEIDAMSDQPAFNFSIICPNKYSNTTAQYREMYGQDKRSRVVSYAEGANGVREWVNKVWNNFDQDTKTRIALDRSSQYGS